MRAHGKEGRMGKRFAIVIGVAALGAAVMAAGASADFRSVHDPRGDTRCIHESHREPRPCSHSTKRSADIVRATAGHEAGRLRHTIRVVGKIDRGLARDQHRFGPRVRVVCSMPVEVRAE